MIYKKISNKHSRHADRPPQAVGWPVCLLLLELLYKCPMCGTAPTGEHSPRKPLLVHHRPPTKHTAVVRPQKALQRLFVVSGVWVWQPQQKRLTGHLTAPIESQKEKNKKFSISARRSRPMIYCLYNYFFIILFVILCRPATCDKLIVHLRQIDSPFTTL